MKNIFYIAAIAVLTLVSCKPKNDNAEHHAGHEHHSDSIVISKDTTTVTESNAVNKDTITLYACPMHPEVQGKKRETCSKCSMELTEPVTK
ncbi:heavy metal-binding domain-containing protein [Flavobacterium sp.]|uniref:heavy metal-binding domain-containing protein n=1 Tax=Flavobacterium sp. TaxID=239 RepID=UPI002FDDB4E2